jgi:hypothetical protein
LRTIIGMLSYGQIDEEIDRLGRARALLTGHTAPLMRGLPVPTGRRKVSAEGWARMAAAQRAKVRRYRLRLDGLVARNMAVTFFR